MNDGSPIARKREYIAYLRVQIASVLNAMRKMQQRYKRNFDANLEQRNRHVKIGDYVYATNHQRANKLNPKAIGPFAVVDANESSFVVDVDGIETRINSNHATPAAHPDNVMDDIPHLILDGLDNPRTQPPVHDEHVIDKLVSHRK